MEKYWRLGWFYFGDLISLLTNECLDPPKNKEANYLLNRLYDSKDHKAFIKGVPDDFPDDPVLIKAIRYLLNQKSMRTRSMYYWRDKWPFLNLVYRNALQNNPSYIHKNELIITESKCVIPWTAALKACDAERQKVWNSSIDDNKTILKLSADVSDTYDPAKSLFVHSLFTALEYVVVKATPVDRDAFLHPKDSAGNPITDPVEQSKARKKMLIDYIKALDANRIFGLPEWLLIRAHENVNSVETEIICNPDYETDDVKFILDVGMIPKIKEYRVQITTVGAAQPDSTKAYFVDDYPCGALP